MLLLPIRYVEVFPLTHLYTNTRLHFWPKDMRQIVVLLRISANFRLFLFIIEQPEVCWLIIFILWICFCTCRDWKQCWMSRSQDPSRSRSPQSLAVLLPPVFKLQSDWILQKLWWHKWVSTGNQWCCWSTNAYSFSAFLGWEVLGTVPFDGGTELLCTKASLLPPWPGNWSLDYCLCLVLCLVLAQQLWIFYSPKDSTSCQLNFHPRQMRKPAW